MTYANVLSVQSFFYLSSYSFIFTTRLMTYLSHIPSDILQSDSTEALYPI